MSFIDTHSHIYGPEFNEDVDEVIRRAKETGVSAVFLPNINEETIDPMLSLCQSHPDYLFPMMGLHPEDVADDYNAVLDRMYDRLCQDGHPYIAVGEVGLDFYWDDSRAEQQKEAFDRQVTWAEELGLPLMIHTRSAHRELLDILSKHDIQKLSGVFHCFGGTAEEAAELMQYENFVLGIGGVLTYKKSTLPEVLKNVPLDRVVVETDAPYLAPVPCRGKRNEPSYARHTVERLALVYDVSAEEVEKQTNANVQRIFSCINA